MADKEKASYRSGKTGKFVAGFAVGKKDKAKVQVVGGRYVVGEPAAAQPGRIYSTNATDLISHYRHDLRSADLRRRVQIEREGVPHDVVKELIVELGTSAAEFQQMVGIPKATFTKKIAHKELFSGASGQSVVGLMELINRVEDMLDPQNPEVDNFDVEAWVGRWIRVPQPALGGETPANLMDTPSGRQSVMRVLGAIESGAYL